MAAAQHVVSRDALVNSCSQFFVDFDAALRRAEQEFDKLLEVDFKQFYAPDEQGGQVQRPSNTASKEPAKASPAPPPGTFPNLGSSQRRQTWHGANDATPAKSLLDNIAAQAAESAEATHALNQVHKARLSKTPPEQPSSKQAQAPEQGPGQTAERFMVNTCVPDQLFPRLQLSADTQAAAGTGAMLSARGTSASRRLSSPSWPGAPLLSARGPPPPKPHGAQQRLAARAGADSVTPPRATGMPSPPVPSAAARVQASPSATPSPPARMSPIAAITARPVCMASEAASVTLPAAATTTVPEVEQRAEQKPTGGRVPSLTALINTPPVAPTPDTAAVASAPTTQPNMSAQRGGNAHASATSTPPTASDGNASHPKAKESSFMATLDLDKVQIFQPRQAVPQQQPQQQGPTLTPLTSRHAGKDATPVQNFMRRVGAKIQNFGRRDRRSSVSGAVASPMYSSASFSGPAWHPHLAQLAGAGLGAYPSPFPQEAVAAGGQGLYYGPQTPGQGQQEQVDAQLQVGRLRRASYAVHGRAGAQGAGGAAGYAGMYGGVAAGYHHAAAPYGQHLYADPGAAASPYAGVGQQQGGYTQHQGGGAWHQQYPALDGYHAAYYADSSYGPIMTPSYARGPQPQARNATQQFPPSKGSATKLAPAAGVASDRQQTAAASPGAGAPLVNPKLTLVSLRPSTLHTLPESHCAANDVMPGTDQD